ncbi:MAG TPA: NAD(P)H-binding protein [Solirubrobacteraceae bacterium]|nr:NAD(P)H-binding protein [Solirubrobacteraceae bacterium]
MKIAVTGATGRVGTHIVDILEAGGHEVVPISRSNGVDVITGEGLDEALAGVECVVDAATGPSPDEQQATEFFTTSARNVQAAADQAGVRRIVLISIVGIDRFSGGYNAAKVIQEQEHLVGPVPVRILRATQFHEFVEQLMDWGRQGDVSYLWRMRTQLVAARTVAEAACELATENKPVRAIGDGPIWEIAGPREESLVEAARRLAARRGEPARVEPVDPPDPLFETGGSLPGPDAVLAGPTFDEWLDSHVIA